MGKFLNERVDLSINLIKRPKHRMCDHQSQKVSLPITHDIDIVDAEGREPSSYTSLWVELLQ